MSPASEGAPRTVVEAHPWLLCYFGSRHPLHCLGFALPLGTVLLLGGIDSNKSLLSHGGLLLLGAAYWTLIEYGLHRWFYHWTPRAHWLRRSVESFHVYHHRFLSDRRVWNAGPLLALPICVIFGAPVLALTRDWATTQMLMLGTTLGYYGYEWFHYSVHTRVFTDGWMARAQRFHMLHHDANWATNFGVSNPYWDRIFRTAFDSPGPSTAAFVARSMGSAP